MLLAWPNQSHIGEILCGFFMKKVLDVTVRMILYPDTGGVILPYHEERRTLVIEDSVQDLSITDSDKSFCRSVSEVCLQMEPLFHTSK